MTHKEKIAKAKELGLEFKGNISAEDLDVLLEEAEQEAEILAKAAKYETPKAEVAEKLIKEVAKSSDKASAVKESTRMIKVGVTALSSNMREIPSEMYSFGNTRTGFKKQVIKFDGKPRLYYKNIIDMLREKETLLQVNTTNNKGKNVTIKQMSPAFGITPEIPLTEEELTSIIGK